MKQPFGAKLAGSYMRSMPWIAANHKKEGVDSISMIGQSCRPSRMIVDFRAVEQFGCGDAAYVRRAWVRT